MLGLEWDRFASITSGSDESKKTVFPFSDGRKVMRQELVPGITQVGLGEGLTTCTVRSS